MKFAPISNERVELLAGGRWTIEGGTILFDHGVLTIMDAKITARSFKKKDRFFMLCPANLLRCIITQDRKGYMPPRVRVRHNTPPHSAAPDGRAEYARLGPRAAVLKW